jgi:hypothetical protein
MQMHEDSRNFRWIRDTANYTVNAVRAEVIVAQKFCAAV